MKRITILVGGLEVIVVGIGVVMVYYRAFKLLNRKFPLLLLITSVIFFDTP